VLATAIDGALRLMHPMIPFITEAIWPKLNEVRPARGIPGRLELPPAELLITAPWPKADPSLIDEAAELAVDELQQVIGAIRNLRNEHKVEPRRTVGVSISAAGQAARHIQANKAMIELLATCTLKEVRADLGTIANAARVSAGGCEIHVEGLVDQDAERSRLAKRREELVKQIAAMRGRLSNESYTAKAPPHLVQQTRDQLAAAEAELAKLG
jgi:valyl-tRNA synthetase